MHVSRIKRWIVVAILGFQRQAATTAFQVVRQQSAERSLSTAIFSVVDYQRQPLPTRLFTFTESATDAESSSSAPDAPLALENPVILFDGVCNFCNSWVDILLRIDVNRRFKFAPLQSNVGKRLLTAVGKDAEDISSVLLIQPDLQFFDKSACVLAVVKELGPVARLASATAIRLVPRHFRDSIYDTVAENRYSLMGKRDECRCGDSMYSDRFLS